MMKKTVFGGAALFGALFSAAVHAADCPPPPSSEMERRTQMITALEETRDDAALGCLIKADDRLVSYNIVLARAVSYRKDAALVDRLLTHPALDTGSQAYKDAAAMTFATTAANNYDYNPVIMGQLLAVFSDNEEARQRALMFIFETAAMNMPDAPNSALTRELVAAGADAEAAIKPYENSIEGQIIILQRQRDRLARFRAEVVGP